MKPKNALDIFRERAEKNPELQKAYLEEKRNMNEWISVKDEKKPKHGQEILLTDGVNVDVGHYYNYKGDHNRVSPIEPIKIGIDKEHFRKKFEKVFENWNYTLGLGFDIYNEKEFFEELMKCFDEE